MSDMSNHPAGTKKAVIHRMVMPKHTCPYGLKAKHLLESRGFTVDDSYIVKVKKHMIGLYAKHCGRTLDEVERTLDRDYFMTAQQAVMRQPAMARRAAVI